MRYEKGAAYRTESGYTGNIDVLDDNGYLLNRIECHGKTREDAETMRNRVIMALELTDLLIKRME